MKQFWVVFCLLISNYSTAQLVINFEDNSLDQWSQYPEKRWKVSDKNPLNGNYSLRHLYDNSESSRDRIAYPYQADLNQHDIRWRFQVRYHYNPSGSNNWGFFLMADTGAAEMHPSGAANGYLVGVNYSGSDDIIKIWKISSGSGYEFINTEYNWQENISQGNPVGFEVTRSSGGKWKIKIDTSGGFDNLSFIGEGDNLDYNTCKNIGLYYEYTSSADSKLWMDDIFIESRLVDSTPPYLTGDSVLNDNQLLLRFSEELDQSTIHEVSNFTLNNQHHPKEVTNTNEQPSSLLLTFEEAFKDSINNSLLIRNLEDNNGNQIRDTTLQFTFLRMRITDFKLLSDSTFTLAFSRVPDSNSLMNIENYTINNGIGNPEKIVMTDSNASRIKVSYSSHFRPDVQYTLHVSNILDENHDPMKPFSKQFTYYEYETNEVVINEIMADPTPARGLPEVEYLELYNQTNSAIELRNWQISTESSSEILPDSSIEPLSYIILCDDNDLDSLKEFGKICALPSLPALKNGGAQLSLLDSNEKIINSVHYNKDWYHDENKDEGGYSLEKIDPENNCTGMYNWKASEDSLGGTPGRKNSVFAWNKDTIAPSLTHFEIISSNELKVEFSENLVFGDSDSMGLFTVSPAIGSPYSIMEDKETEFSYHLFFAKEFRQNNHYTFNTKEVTDQCGNQATFNIPFTYHQDEPYDILINEVMADPEPPMELPEEEYIELYNRSDFDISLKEWKLYIGNSKRYLPDTVIPSKSYLILCDTSATKQFKLYGHVLGVERFPSISNSGEPTYLINKKGMVIDYLHFQSDWHESDYKSDGGWAIELTDPLNPCGKQENWSSSVDPTGGTPGKENSTKDENPDQKPIRIQYVSFLDSSKIMVHFNETYERTKIINSKNYFVDDVGNPDHVELVPPDHQKIILSFSKPFKKHRRYTLEVDNEIEDCVGNPLASNYSSCEFEIPEKPEQNDLVINELLYDPVLKGTDFIELYNRASKTIVLSDLCFINESDNPVCLDDDNRPFFPGNYLVFTRDKNLLEFNYHVPYPDRVVEVENLPNFSNEEGIAAIYDKTMNSIDIFEYNSSMHFPLLNSTEGVSLERIHYDRKTSEHSNWHSASADAGYATPGYKNSQYVENKAIDERFHVEPEVFSPDNDGRDDVLSIQYNLDKPGYVATIKIFDKKGRLIRQLLNNKTLSTEGSILWNGLDGNKRKARVGIYIIYIEFFDLDGNVKSIKKHCVLARKY